MRHFVIIGRRVRGRRVRPGNLPCPRALTLLLCLGATWAGGCIGDPMADAATTEAIHEIVNELGMLRDDNAVLQFQVDSLRAVVARQDTLLRHVANLSGIPITR